ncbi:MAG TPA: sialidase family protein, partial [Candidatus Kapabacteria bacterium]|nr:sialidase family protein [Candidatus Kapabacteria bacterium]
MKKIVLSILLVFFYTTVSNAQHSWKKLDGPNGGHIQAVIAKPDGTIFTFITINTSKRVLLRSTDHGQTWQNCTPNLPQFDLATSAYNEIAVPAFIALPNGDIVMHFKNQTTSRLYLSSDNANSWTVIKDRLQILKATGKLGEYFITVSSDNKIYHTVDNGANWTSLSTPITSYFSIQWLGGDQYIAYYGARDIYLSTDNCKTWWQASSIKDQGYSTIIDGMYAMSNGIFIARVGMFLYQSDLKTPWTIVDSLTKFYTVSTSGITNIYRSTNNELVGLVSLDPLQGDNCKMYVFDTAKKEFVTCPLMPVSPYNAPVWQATAPKNCLFSSDTLGWLYYTDNTALYRTSDLGNSWEELPLHYQDINNIQVDGFGRIFTKSLKPFTNAPGTIHGWEGDFTWINMSQNQGRSWSKISPLPFPVAGLLGPGYERGTIVSA